MTQDKELLLKDLCARLPYDVKVKIPSMESPLRVLSINTNGVTWVRRDTGYPLEIDWKNCKPYLFPLSNMTEEERITIGNEFAYGQPHKAMDILHQRHIDYKGLIPMGLAIDATGLNIY